MSYRALTALVFLATILYGSIRSKPIDPIRINPPRTCLGCRGID